MIRFAFAWLCYLVFITILCVAGFELASTFFKTLPVYLDTLFVGAFGSSPVAVAWILYREHLN